MGRVARRRARREAALAADPEGGGAGATEAASEAALQAHLARAQYESQRLQGAWLAWLTLFGFGVACHALALARDHLAEGHAIGVGFQLSSCLSAAIMTVSIRASAGGAKGSRGSDAGDAGSSTAEDEGRRVQLLNRASLVLALAHVLVWAAVSVSQRGATHPLEHMFPVCALFFGTGTLAVRFITASHTGGAVENVLRQHLVTSKRAEDCF